MKWIITAVIIIGVALGFLFIKQPEKLSPPFGVVTHPKDDTVLNQKIDDMRALIDTAQQTYFQNNGRYFQGILTHDTLPSRTNELLPDVAKKPEHQQETWSDFLGQDINKKLPFAIQINTLKRLEEQWYEVYFLTNENGTVYIKKDDWEIDLLSSN